MFYLEAACRYGTSNETLADRMHLMAAVEGH